MLRVPEGLGGVSLLPKSARIQFPPWNEVLTESPYSSMFSKSDRLFLAAALLSFLASVGLWFLHSHGYGLFVGLWVPSILALWTGTKVSCLTCRLAAARQTESNQ